MTPEKFDEEIRDDGSLLDVDTLDANFTRLHGVEMNIAPQESRTFEISALDGYLTPVAWMWHVVDHDVPHLARTMRISTITIDGVRQMGWIGIDRFSKNAEPWIDTLSMLSKPAAVRFGTFTGATYCAPLRVIATNPYPRIEPPRTIAPVVKAPPKRWWSRQDPPIVNVHMPAPEPVAGTYLDALVTIWGAMTTTPPSEEHEVWMRRR